VEAEVFTEEGPVTDKQDPVQIMHELLVRQRVSELRARYCWYVSRGDYEGMVQLYTPDGLFEFSVLGPRETHRGHAQLREGLARSVYPGEIFPMVRNEVTVVDGDTAVGTCTMEARTTHPDMPRFSGYYHDRFRVHDGVWRFAERRFFRYMPVFERSGLDIVGAPETGLSAQHDRKRSAS